MKKPIRDKFKDINSIEVIKIGEYEFSIKPINHNQAKYLDNFYDYFYENPESFLPFLDEVILNKDDVEHFFENPKIGLHKTERIKILVNSVCVEALSVRPKSFDYAFTNAVTTIIERRNIMDQFITVLIGFGYKKHEINNFSNLNIITLALEELFYRDKTDFLEFVSKIIGGVELPLIKTLKSIVMNYMGDIKLQENDAQTFNDILGYMEKGINQTSKPVVNRPGGYKLKTKSEAEMFSKIPE